MSIDKQLVERFVKSIEEQKKLESSDDKYANSIKYIEGIYVFISFDLVNSTLFKSRHMELWPGFISAFYECVATAFALGRYRDGKRKEESESWGTYERELERTGGFQLWKLVGDEVLLYHKVVSKEELYKTVLYVDSKRKKLIDDTIDIYFRHAKVNNDAHRDKEIDEKAIRRLFFQYFDVKTTVWIGSCTSNSGKVSIEHPNVLYDPTALSSEVVSSYRQLDFLGPDIDEGFRLCEYSEKKQMIVSPKLVYLLLLAFKEDQDKINVLNLNFRIVNYDAMNGVWEKRPYPIIMFCQCNLEEGPSLTLWKKNFEYDAFNSSFLYANIDKYGEKFLDDERFSIRKLKNIYADIVRTEEMEAMLRIFEEQEKEVETLSPDVFRNKNAKFEFHISCLCYDPDQKKFWITNHKTHGWSFGCIQVTQNKNYYQHVSKLYKEKYNLEISLSQENEILSFYSANRNSSMPDVILGVVVLVIGAVETEKKDGIESQWVTHEEAMAVDGTKSDNYELALEKAKQIIDGKSTYSDCEGI